MSWTEGLHRARIRANELVDLTDMQTPEQLAASLEKIAAFRGAVVRRAPLDGIDGRLVRGRRRGIITVSDRHSGTRQRFSVAHELWHFELHVGVDQTFTCTSRDMVEYRRSGEEREANYFAAQLLMPDVLFAPLSEDPPPTVALVQELANRFDTSLTSTAIRLVEMSVHRCAVVVSTTKGIQWALPSEDFGFAIDRKRPAMSPYSFAHDVLAGEGDSPRASEVDPDTWLYFDDLRDGSRLFESSMGIGRHGALTMLWLR